MRRRRAPPLNCPHLTPPSLISPLCFVGVSDAGKTTRALRTEVRALQRLRVRVLEGPDEGVSLAAEGGRPMAVGVAPGNELALSDPTVSRFHVEVRTTDSGIHVRDLHSLNGTFVSGVRIESATVPPGTQLRLGATLLVLEEAGDAGATEAGPAVDLPGFVAESAVMRDVASTVRRLAHSGATVLLQGETGTGKEVVARAIHDLSPRRGAPFVVVDCGSLPSTLVASELFGHERGAFTGADRQKPGAFELAHGGTIFLDEIGELPSDVQPSLLGVLERRRFRRVGGEREIEVDVRVVTATHRELREAANTGAFRPDLYYRLSVARLILPPLRERPEDVPVLVRHFANELTGQAAVPFDPETMERLRNHHWSGNVRELRNVVEGALAMGRVVLEGSPKAPASGGTAHGAIRPYKEARAEVVGQFERDYLTALLEACDGNASEASRRAKMDRSYLLMLLKKHDLR